MKKTTTLSRKTIRNRAIGLAILFVAAASIAYTPATNYVLEKAQSILGIKNIARVNKNFVLGLDLQGGTSLEYAADVSKIPEIDRREALNGVRDVIERRVNSLGVSEPLIQTTRAGEDWRVTVELAGIKDVNEAIKLIGDTPILEFKEMNPEAPRDLTADEQKKMDADNKAAQDRANAFLTEARKPGANFTDLTKEKTENPIFKEQGGLLGDLYTSQQVPSEAGTTTRFTASAADADNLYEAVAGLKAGDIVPEVIERANSYAIIKVESLREEGKEIQGNHLLIGYTGAEGSTSTSTKEQARARIDELKKQATKENFVGLVRQFSQEPNASSTAGEIPWMKPGDLVPAFEKAMVAAPMNAVSDVVETQYGFHLILKTGERPFQVPSLRLSEFKRITKTDILGPQEEWKATKLTGRELQSSRVDFDQRTGNIQVALQFNDQGAQEFADLTRRNIGKQIAIFLDGEAISAPTVNDEITGGQAVISGNFNLEEAKLLARRLQAGALPVPIELIAQQTIGPSLGIDSLQQSVKAGLIGFLFVAIFMIAFYRLPGVVAVASLLLYAALSATAFKMIPVTLTLAGIAGFILTLGIAVDANVLVYERLKEELKEGKTIPQAMEDAFRRAWLSIRDGHMTVLISASVLYWFSSSVIKGFALTLAIGTLISLFTAVVGARTILRVLANSKLNKYGWLFLKK